MLEKISMENKIRFEKIVKIICEMFLENEQNKKEVRQLEEKLDLEFEESNGGYDIANFSLILGKELTNIEFCYGYGRNYYNATIDLTNNDCPPETILYWDNTLEELEKFIKEQSPIIYKRIVEKVEN